MIDPIQLDTAQLKTDGASFKTPSHPVAAKFASVLQQTMQTTKEVRFSAHALQRMNDRNIQFTEQDHLRLNQSIADAEAKGAKESLILMDQLALIVGVPNRTVITVMEPQAGDNTVITNIDSVVVAAKEFVAAGGSKTNGLDPFLGSPSVTNR